MNWDGKRNKIIWVETNRHNVFCFVVPKKFLLNNTTSVSDSLLVKGFTSYQKTKYFYWILCRIQVKSKDTIHFVSNAKQKLQNSYRIWFRVHQKQEDKINFGLVCDYYCFSCYLTVVHKILILLLIHVDNWNVRYRNNL